MYFLTDICFLCLKNNIEVKSVLTEDTDGIGVNVKLRCFFPEIIDSTPDAHKLACSECLERLRISYDFKQSVVRNNTVFRDYINKLQCQQKSYQQLLVKLTRFKHHTIIPVTRDFAANKDKKCGENNLKLQNENYNLTSINQEQLNTHDQPCQHTTNENNVVFTKSGWQTKEINIKNENMEIEEIHIKEELHVGDNFSRNYLDEDSKKSKDNIYECQICHLGFSSPIYLENHTSGCDIKIKKPEGFVSKHIKDDTVSKHNDNGSFKCHICDNMYTIKSFYDRHLLVKHYIYENDTKQETNSKYNENNGTKSTDLYPTSSYSRYNDERTNKEAKNTRYKSTDCPKALTISSKPEARNSSNSLNTHKLTHTGEKSHDYDMCQTSFKTKRNLIKDKRTRDVRPYQCSICEMKFTRTNHLTTHMYIHTGQKPYHCHICQYECTHPVNLKKHVIRTHTEKRPYSCKHCQKSYGWANDLKEHIKKHHNESV